MDLVDGIELDVLAEFGDPEAAEAVGMGLRIAFEVLGVMLGVPADWMERLSDE